MYKDSLFRVSFKCLIIDTAGQILVVKERNRSSWDIPGGGIEHGETIDESIARELSEEVSFYGDFTHSVIKIHDPVKLLTRDVWQIKIVVLLKTGTNKFSAGDNADEIKFMDPTELRHSDNEAKRRIAEYYELADIGRKN